MDRTASFLLAKHPATLKALAPSGSVALNRWPASGSAGRLAAPLRDLPPLEETILYTFLVTMDGFDFLISGGDMSGSDSSGRRKCPCSKSGMLGNTTDEVTVAGNKGLILTTALATATVNESRVIVDLSVKTTGEVRDAVTGEILYRIATEATGHADGDTCPDASGTARAHLTFSYHEDYFSGSGAKSGSLSEGFGGELRIIADDNARVARVDLTTTGRNADFWLPMAARMAAPAFEKGWRSGMCIEVVVNERGGYVEQNSVTTVTATVRHKIEGTELKAPVEAILDGEGSIDPAKQPAPATFRYTAGPFHGDEAHVLFESVSNRGVGKETRTFSAVGGLWTLNIVGSTTQTEPNVSLTLRFAIRDFKLIQEPLWRDPVVDLNGLHGEGTVTYTGPLHYGISTCYAEADETHSFSIVGTHIGTGPGSVLRLTWSGYLVWPVFTCANSPPAPLQASVGIANVIGTLDLPAEGGTMSLSGSRSLGGNTNASWSGTFTVVRERR